MILEAILVLECIQSFVSGLRTGKFIIDAFGFKHGKELDLAAQFLNRAVDCKDKGAAKEAIKWFGKVQLDEVVYFRSVSFFGMAVCNIVLEEYVVSHQYCLSAIELDPSIYKERVAIIQQKARELKYYIESNNLLSAQKQVRLIRDVKDETNIVEHHQTIHVTAVKPELDYKTILNNLQDE